MGTALHYDKALAAIAIRDALDASAECRHAEQPRDMARAVGRAHVQLERMAEQLEAANAEVRRLEAERDARPRVSIESVPLVSHESEYEGRHPANCGYAVMDRRGLVVLDITPVLEAVLDAQPCCEAAEDLERHAVAEAELEDKEVRIFWRAR